MFQRSLHPENGGNMDSEMLVSYHSTTWRHNSEDLDLIYHCLESLKTRTIIIDLLLIYVDYGLDDRGSFVRLPVGTGNFLFTTASRTALGSTQPPIQWVPGALSLGVKRPGRGADHSPSSNAEVKG
jgi:hypothetical protein